VVSKQATHIFIMERFNLKSREQFRVEISNRSAMNINKPCQVIRENIQISGYYEMKKQKPWFD
jgi:hypothetical protein